MKTMMKDIRTLGAAILFGVALSACSNDDILNEQPVNPTQQVYTMTIQASKGGDDATTRGLYWADYAKKTLNANWTGKEKVRVVQNGSVIGTLSATISSDKSTTLSGTVTGADLSKGIKFILLADEDGQIDYTGQNGAMMEENGTGNIEENYDYASYELTAAEFMQAFTLNGTDIKPKDGTYITFVSQQAIVRFELQKPTNNLGTEWGDLYAKKLIVTDKNTGKLVQTYDATTGAKTYGHIAATLQSGTGSTFYVALNFDDASDIMLQAIDADGNLYTYEKSSVTFTKGKYYRVSVKMHQCTKFPLDQITCEDTYFKGWYIGGSNDGYAYQLYSSGCAAVIAYVGKVPGYFNNYIALGLKDIKSDGTVGSEELDSWETALTAVNNYAANTCPVTIGTTTYNTNTTGSSAYDQVAYNETSNTRTDDALIGWRLPSVTDWRYIIDGLCGSPSATDPIGVREGEYSAYHTNIETILSKLNDEQGPHANLSRVSYYTSSEYSDNTFVWWFRFETEGNKGFVYNLKSYNAYARPVFAY